MMTLKDAAAAARIGQYTVPEGIPHVEAVFDGTAPGFAMTEPSLAYAYVTALGYALEQKRAEPELLPMIDRTVGWVADNMPVDFGCHLLVTLTVLYRLFDGFDVPKMTRVHAFCEAHAARLKDCRIA